MQSEQRRNTLTLDTFVDTTEQKSLSLPDERELKQGMDAIRRFQNLVHANMIADHDFGTIPGTQKPTLLKPGAEKIIKLFTPALIPEYEISATEDWERPFFNFQVTCRLSLFGSDPKVYVDMGVGSCNSLESKYRWRWVWPNDLTEDEKKGLVHRTVKGGGRQYRLPTDDIYSQVNTLLKMAKKRSLVDAALSAGRLSDLFTQDIEDIPFIAEAVAPAPQQAESNGAICPEDGAPMTMNQWGKYSHNTGTKKADGKALWHNFSPEQLETDTKPAPSPVREAPQATRTAPPTDVAAPQHIETFSELWNVTMKLHPELKTMQDLLAFYQVTSESGLLERYSSLDEAFQWAPHDQPDLFG